MEWQLIESAPKDGSEILIAIQSKMKPDSWNRRVAFWRDGEGWLLVGVNFGRIQGARNPPSHWMPLPPPPAAADKR